MGTIFSPGYVSFVVALKRTVWTWYMDTNSYEYVRRHGHWSPKRTSASECPEEPPKRTNYEACVDKTMAFLASHMDVHGIMFGIVQYSFDILID